MSKQDVIDYVMETPHNTNRAVLEGLVDTAVEEGQVQADWDQNDPTAKDYIKNRIGGYYNTIATADSGTLTTTSFVDFTEQTDTTSYAVNAETFYTALQNLDITVGKTYRISWIDNGQAFSYTSEATANMENLPIILGDTVINLSATPKLVWGNKAKVIVADIIVTATDTITNIKIEEINVVKIPDEFLSDKVFDHPVSRGTGSYSVVEGYGTKATQYCAHAEGGSTTASAWYSHAEGGSTTASGSSSHAEGANTTASGSSSHAAGQSTKALGSNSYATGNGTKALGSNSYATGYYTVAAENSVMVSGQYNIYEQLTYTYSEATATFKTEGNKNYYCSKSFSFDTTTGEFTLESPTTITFPQGISLKRYYFSESITSSIIYFQYGAVNYTGTDGNLTITAGFSKLTSAKNSSPEKYKYLQVVGNGLYEEARANAYTLDRFGNAWYAGDVYVGSTSGTDKDDGSKKLATEEYVDNHRVTIDTALSSTSKNAVQNKVVKTAIDEVQNTVKEYIGSKVSDKELILFSSTENSTKKFKITVNDSGTISAKEVTEGA
jgi:hypothetical protein